MLSVSIDVSGATARHYKVEGDRNCTTTDIITTK
jgi:hypothetical protein